MKYRKLTNTGDYTFGTNNNFLDGIEAVGQKIKTSLLLFSGEWWEDLNLGIPMFQSILGQVNTTNVANALKNLIEKKLLGFEEVTSLKDIQINIEGRNIQLTVKAIVGEEEIEVEVSN